MNEMLAKLKAEMQSGMSTWRYRHELAVLEREVAELQRRFNHARIDHARMVVLAVDRFGRTCGASETTFEEVRENGCLDPHCTDVVHD